MGRVYILAHLETQRVLDCVARQTLSSLVWPYLTWDIAFSGKWGSEDVPAIEWRKGMQLSFK